MKSGVVADAGWSWVFSTDAIASENAQYMNMKLRSPSIASMQPFQFFRHVPLADCDNAISNPLLLEGRPPISGSRSLSEYSQIAESRGMGFSSVFASIPAMESSTLDGGFLGIEFSSESMIANTRTGS